MSMMAVFACCKCSAKSIQGYYRGLKEPAPPPQYACLNCKAKTGHIFQEYTYIDERSDAQRMRDKYEST